MTAKLKMKSVRELESAGRYSYFVPNRVKQRASALLEIVGWQIEPCLLLLEMSECSLAVLALALRHLLVRASLFPSRRVNQAFLSESKVTTKGRLAGCHLVLTMACLAAAIL